MDDHLGSRVCPSSSSFAQEGEEQPLESGNLDGSISKKEEQSSGAGGADEEESSSSAANSAPIVQTSDDSPPASSSSVILLSQSELNKNDVMLGRGTGPNDYEGNVRYRSLVRQILKKAYGKTQPSQGRRPSQPPHTFPSQIKSTLAHQIVHVIQCRGGRFLERVVLVDRADKGAAGEEHEPSSPSSALPRVASESPVLYRVVDDSVAIDKTKQSFRHQIRSLSMYHEEKQGELRSITTSSSGLSSGVLVAEQPCREDIPAEENDGPPPAKYRRLAPVTNDSTCSFSSVQSANTLSSSYVMNNRRRPPLPPPPLLLDLNRTTSRSSITSGFNDHNHLNFLLGVSGLSAGTGGSLPPATPPFSPSSLNAAGTGTAGVNAIGRFTDPLLSLMLPYYKSETGAAAAAQQKMMRTDEMLLQQQESIYAARRQYYQQQQQQQLLLSILMEEEAANQLRDIRRRHQQQMRQQEAEATFSISAIADLLLTRSIPPPPPPPPPPKEHKESPNRSITHRQQENRRHQEGIVHNT